VAAGAGLLPAGCSGRVDLIGCAIVSPILGFHVRGFDGGKRVSVFKKREALNTRAAVTHMRASKIF